MDNLFKIPATLTKYNGMRNRSMRLTFDSQENLTDEQISKISRLHEKFVWLVTLHEQAKESEILEQIKDLPPLVKDDDDKSPSKRLRDRMFVYYSTKNQTNDGFNEWYVKYLDKLGQNFLDKVN